MSDMDKIRITELVLKSLSGCISDEEFVELDAFVASSRANGRYFTSLIAVYMAMVDYYGSVSCKSCFESGMFDPDIWKALADEEKNAPTVDIKPKELKRQLIQKVERPKVIHEISKFNLISGILSVAAALFFILFLKFAPVNNLSVDVAVLADQINTKWAQTDVDLSIGSRLWTNGGQLILESGIVKISYYEGVEVLIEGPAAFEVERSEIYLEYGRLCGVVSETGLGFIVRTPNSKFIDHGTEFAVQADVNGSSELHVTKGKVQIFAGSINDPKTGQMVTANTAVRYNAKNNLLSAISVEKTAFVRSISSKNNVVWRGQKELSLTDVVAEGDGFGAGHYNKFIDMKTGKSVDTATAAARTVSGFVRVEGNPFIDGIFVPDGNDGKEVQISSEGDFYNGCPDTDGVFWTEVYPNYGNSHHRPTEITLDGKKYEQATNPSLFMHANSGITFDLDNIRQANSSLRISDFTALCGIVDKAKDGIGAEPLVDFIVLLDGDEKYRKNGVKAGDGAAAINIKIEKNNRYLTLIVTDGGNGHEYDWGLFARPMLVILE